MSWCGLLNKHRLRLLCLLFILAQVPRGTYQVHHRDDKVEKQRYDGWYNNMAHPKWGSVGSSLTRKTPAAYSDGVYQPAGWDRPSARLLSEAFMKGHDGQGSLKNRTAMLAFFGQVVSNEILMASEQGCPIELRKIPIETCDEMYDKECDGGKYMPFWRTRYDPSTGMSVNRPREQLNSMTSWIDGSFIYSTSEAWVAAMRSFENGTFRSESDGKLPPRNKERAPLHNEPSPHLLSYLSPERMFLLGDPRSNQNPALLSFSIMFFRYHNLMAAHILEQHPDWSDEDIFQKTRRKVVAVLQNIIMYEYLPAFLGTEVKPYTRYQPDTHPGISHVFQSAAFRFGHSLVPPGIYRRNEECEFRETPKGGPAYRLCATWWDATAVVTNPQIMEEILLGLASQISEKEDPILCSDVRNKLFGPMEFSRRDLGALNIMRGRDNGLPDYNTVRMCFQLPQYHNFREINPRLADKHPQLFKELENLYNNNLMDIDLYIGGMLETIDGPGELFTVIIKEQFERLRDSDRFWFENPDGFFTESEIEEIRKIRLYDVIIGTTSISPDALQKNVFFFADGDPCPQPTQLNTSHLEPCKHMQGYDYFHDSEVTYIYACILVCIIPVLTAAAGYCVIKLQNRRRRQYKLLQEEKRVGKSVDRMVVKEWLHQNHKRLVKIKFGPEQEFHIVNRKGENLRTVDFRLVEKLTVEETQDQRKKPMLLVRVPKDYDMVLEFDSIGSRKRFMYKLENFLSSHKKLLESNPTFRDQMLANAETKERRQKRLEHFFREAYTLTFGIKPGEKRKIDETTSDVIMVMRTSLSRAEFASALGMKENDVFVKRMFNIVDKDGDGRICFQEFLDTVVLFTKGKTEDKLHILFDMCDTDRNGVIDKGELSEMMRSLVEIAKTNKSMSDEEVVELIDGMFRNAGLEDKDVLSYSDFKVMMREYKGDFVAIGLDCKGAKQNFLDTSTNVARMTSFHVDALNEEYQSTVRKKWDYHKLPLIPYTHGQIILASVSLPLKLPPFFSPDDAPPSCRPP